MYKNYIDQKRSVCCKYKRYFLLKLVKFIFSKIFNCQDENNKLRKRTPQNVTCNFESVKKTANILQLDNDHLNSTQESNDMDKSVTKILSKYGRTLQKTASTLNTANTQSTGGQMKTLKKIFEYNKYVDWSFHANETIQ